MSGKELKQESVGRLVFDGIQHIAALCSGAMAVPMIVAGTLKLSPEDTQFLISATLMVCGIGSIIQSMGIGNLFGAKLPMMEGVTFKAVSSLTAIAATYAATGSSYEGLSVIFGATLASGIFIMLAAPIIGKILRFFPMLVSGIVVTSMGLSLVPTALKWIGGGNPSAPDFASPDKIMLALFTFVTILVIQKMSRGFLGNIAILIGLCAGTIVASMFGMVNFSKVLTAQSFSFNTPFYFGMPKFQITAIVSMILVQLTVMIDAVGNHITLSDICGAKSEERMVPVLRAHGLCSAIAGIFNSYPQAIFGQNVGVVALTKRYDRRIGVIAGLILLVLTLFPKVTAALTAIPLPVLGGAGIIMFGMVVANGIKLLGSVNYVNNKNLMIVAISLGMALIPITVPQMFKNTSNDIKILFNSAIILGAMTSILLNIIFNELGTKKAEVK
ncbi:MAG: nucleobase:cation symporter-2 family protein [Fusobacteriaceae bacterium]